MNVALIFFVLISSILSTCTTMPAMVADQTPLASTETEIQQQRLDVLAVEFESLSKMVKPSLLDKAQKTKYLQFLHACSSMQTELTQKIVDNNDCSHERLFLMEQFVEYIKMAHLKMELVTVGRNTCNCAFLDKPLEQRHYNQALATVQLEIYTWLTSCWRTKNTSVDELSNESITGIVAQALETAVPKAFPVDFFKDACADRLAEALALELYNFNSILFDEYFSCMEQCQNFKYAYDSKISQSLLCRIDSLIVAFQHHNPDFSQDRSEIVSRSFNFFVTKLFCTRQEIMFSQQLHDVNTLHPTLISTFMKHNRLIKSDEFTSTYTTLSRTDRECLDRYIMLMDHFFTTSSCQSLLFVHDIESMIADFVIIIKKINTPKSWWTTEFLEFVKKSQDRLTDLLDHIETNLGLKKTAPEKTVYSERTIIEEMLEVLTSVHLHITQKPEETGSTWADIAAYVQSGKWFTGSVVQNEEGNIALELASQALDSTKFTDAKSAAKQALIYASPFLFAKIVEYLRPRLGKKVETTVDALINQKGNDTLGNNNKIIDFAKNNPEILKQLTQEHPEILDLLAESLKELARKNI